MNDMIDRIMPYLLQLLDGLGPNAATEILKKDTIGRTSLHWAALGSSADVVRVLMNCQRELVKKDLEASLSKLQNVTIQTFLSRVMFL